MPCDVNSKDLSADIKSISMDYRKIAPDSLFVALKGKKFDGHCFIQQAIEYGAKAVISEVHVDCSVPLIVVKNVREHLGPISSAVYGHPSKSMTIIGVTGTNGKTTVAFLIDAILREAGLNSGYIGTVDYRWSGKTQKSERTTPEAPELQELLSKMRSSEVSHVVIECSSHGIEFGRLNSINFDVCVFTNLTQDHLDHHGTMTNYANIKKQLFTQLLASSQKQNKWAIFNHDDVFGKEWAKSNIAPSVSYSISPKSKASVKPLMIDVGANGISLELVVDGQPIQLKSKLLGAYNASNLIAATTVACKLGVHPKDIESALTKFSVVPGRLERIPSNADLNVFVDYAHTDDAMTNVLSTLKKICEGRLIVVFGCGGDRDKSKRPKMMRAVENFAAVAIVTIDNPRSESPQSIIEDTLEGLSKESNLEVYTILDRREAIRKGIQLADPMDMVIITGKGHEVYQEVGGQFLSFDDRLVAKEILEGIHV
ncbi:MAG: UDP-N-acetylmuramoyl-L-alanyl-D-glutamate--2,6-diaminopimelate ligase [Bdellovibrionales bacterium]|nr:UDP-N-acetylmuramoyl-L-alanyl-D-glutamate--2,6-diaminopimelate ligase [Bdellovibrionales bacterium]